MTIQLSCPAPTPPCVILFVNAARQRLEVRIPQYIGETLRTTQVVESDFSLTPPQYDPVSGELETPLSVHCVLMLADYGNIYEEKKGCPVPILEARMILDSEPYALGTLSAVNAPQRVSYLHPEYPRYIAFEVTRIATDYLRETNVTERTMQVQETDEQKLVEEVVEVLETDAYRGSLSSTYVQSLVLNSSHYAPTIANIYRGKWHTFLSVHDIFHLFKYTSEEVLHYGLMHTCHGNELRVALCRDIPIMIVEDQRRDLIRHHAECEVHDFLHQLLRTYGECDSQFLMKQLENNCGAYKNFSHPSYNVLERVVRMNIDKLFEIHEDSVRGTMISLKKMRSLVDNKC